jgi:hypothetical protein
MGGKLASDSDKFPLENLNYRRLSEKGFPDVSQGASLLKKNVHYIVS